MISAADQVLTTGVCSYTVSRLTTALCDTFLFKVLLANQGCPHWGLSVAQCTVTSDNTLCRPIQSVQVTKDERWNSAVNLLIVGKEIRWCFQSCKILPHSWLCSIFPSDKPSNVWLKLQDFVPVFFLLSSNQSNTPLTCLLQWCSVQVIQFEQSNR